MRIIRDLETLLSGHLGTAAVIPLGTAAYAGFVNLGTAQGISFRSASDSGALPSKPHGIVKASVNGRKGSLLDGEVVASVCYMPTQGADSNGTGYAIFDIGEAVANALSDAWATLQACNLGTSYTYMTMRFGGGSVESDGEHGREIQISGYWTARKKTGGI